MKVIISLIAIFFASTTFAGGEHDHTPIKVSTEFENMKALVGTWEGKTKMDGKDQDLKVTYELTSGGTALIEKMNPGTPMEMVTVYANNGKKVHATHYCALGNQPEMKLKNSKNNIFVFEMIGTNGLSNKNEMHMHGVTITLDGNKLKQEWMNFKNGKKGEVHAFELAKKI
jgi:hypothetical protein